MRPPRCVEGNVRSSSISEENIRISQHTMHVLEIFGDDMETVGFRPDPSARHEGNLFMVDETGDAAHDGLNTQRSFGCDVEWLDSNAVAAEFPAYESVGLVGGTLGRRDGRVDALAMLRGIASRPVSWGAEYLTAEVTAITRDGGKVSGVTTSVGDISGRHVWLAAGAWTPELVRPLGIDLPVLPVMRTVYVVASTIPTHGLPALFLPSGAYAIPEGEHTWVWPGHSTPIPLGFDFTPPAGAIRRGGVARHRGAHPRFRQSAGRVVVGRSLRREHA